jgi:quercetin dioxygenase-like cupin family protein
MSNSATIVDLRAPVETPADGIVSRAIYSDDDVRVVHFSFAPGQQLSDHTAPWPVTLEVVDGEATITLADDTVEARAGTWIHMPASMSHSVVAKTPLVLLLHLLKRGG